MSTGMRTAPRAASEETRNQIKAAAQMLFARHGVDAVTVQQIVEAAGQRNNAALHYHFGSKEELIRQMVVDGAAVLDERRQGMLRELEARGGPLTIRDLMLVLVMPVIEQRLTLFSIYANAILSAREAALETRKGRSNRLWDRRFTTENILDTLE